jgi:hypothetical protein
MNNRELATVLAALRHWQHCDQSTMALVRHAWHKRNPNAPHPPDALDIACDCGAFLPLDPAEVSALCERLNATERLDPTADAGDGSGGPDRTPGPWEAEPNEPGEFVPGSWRVNHQGTRQWVASQVTGEADARLIAAAPNLLAQCEAALAYLLANVPKGNIRNSAHFHALNEHAALCKSLRAAIAKALGKSE